VDRRRPTKVQEIACEVEEVNTQVADLSVAELPGGTPTARMETGVVISPRRRTDKGIPIEIVWRCSAGGETLLRAIVRVNIDVSNLAERTRFDELVPR